jgi:hypothetical protein
VLLHVPSGRYLRVNESAAKIVGLLSAGHSLTEAARRFAASEDISSGAAEADVRSLIDSLAALERAAARPLPAHRLRAAARLMLQWSRLPRQLRWPAVQAAGLLCVVEIGLRTTDLRRLSALARVPLDDSPQHRALPQGDLSHLQRGERRMLVALEWLETRWFIPLTCLRRALVTGFALRRRDPVLRLGITNGGTTAHAWIEAGGAGYGIQDVSGVFAAPA